MKIGFFDSGLGGLLMLKSVAKFLPEYDYEFYGDTSNLPYGNKTEAEIFELTKKGVLHLFQKKCALVIIACNTASAATTRRLQDELLKNEYKDRKILGVIIPTVEEVIEFDCKQVLLIGTNRTIDSGKYKLEFSRYENAPKLISVATPELVPKIENGDIENAVREVLTVVKENEGIDALILGCTHYAILKQKISEQLSVATIKIFSQDEIIPKKLESYLANHKEVTDMLTRAGGRNIHLTDNNPRYDSVIQELLGGAFIAD